MNMQQYIDFLLHHWELSLAFVVILLALIALEIRNKIMGIAQISSQETTMLINREDAIVLDIREPAQFGNGHIIDSINIPLAQLDTRISELEKHKERPIIIVSNVGQSTQKITSLLQKAGFTKIKCLKNGITTWQNASLPLVK